jgi:RNA polymerase sigma-70 factor (ECF subfamily)
LILRAVEDADLIISARKGNVEAFNHLVSRWEKRVYNYLLRLTGRSEDSLDLCQDVFLKAYQNLRKLDDPNRFGPWLYRIAHNEAYSMFRKRHPDTSGDAEMAEREPAPGVSPEVSIAVNAAMDRLTPEQREAVVLKVHEGFKFDEMAEILGCPVSTIKSRLYTALELMKAELEPMTNRGIR